jgi:hypothetical protein
MLSVIYIYLRIIAFTVNLVICFETLVIFGERVRKHHNRARIMHFTGFLASMSGVSYSLVQIGNLFGGPWSVGCDNILIVGGCLVTGGISLALLHLFLRADLLNRNNNKHWQICRGIASLFMIFNIISFSFYLKMRTVIQLPSGICIYNLNQKALIFRYVSQATNHIVQTLLFVYPLLRHMRNMTNIQKENHLESNMDNSIYINLTNKAVIAMIISTSYTLSLVVVVCFYKESVQIQRIIIPLSNFDMAITIGSVCYASTSLSKKKKRPSVTHYHTHRLSISQRRSSDTSSVDNDTHI